MHSHSASERSVGYLFLIRARVANHYPTHPFRTVSEGEFCELRHNGVLRSFSLDLARIGSPLFIFAGSPSYEIGPSLVFGTFATRLSAQPLRDTKHRSVRRVMSSSSCCQPSPTKV